ncbi:regulatory protein RecX [Usitatibacter palustris]|uniref:regulatory protein RecX n=1 Tax=Usitatibacter palustris TaxID=2732487 RepID=UPI001FE7C442
MRLLARREHSREELRRKLARDVEAQGEVEALLDDLSARGWLSDVRFAELTARAKASRFGPLKLAHYLKSRGIADEAIVAGVQAAGADGRAQVAVVWRTRFKAAPNDEREKLKHVRFLQGRGFPLDEIFRFLKELETSNEPA